MGTTVYDDVFSTGLGGQRNNNGRRGYQRRRLDGCASIRWLVNDNWTITASANYQDLEADGFNDYDPSVGDLEVEKLHLNIERVDQMIW